MNKKYRTDLFLPDSSFLEGMGSVLEIAGDSYFLDYPKNPAEASGLAIQNNWKVVGDTMRECFEKHNDQKEQ